MIKVAFLIDPIERLKPHTDTSVYLMASALKKGYQVFSFHYEDLSMSCSSVMAKCREITDVHHLAKPWCVASEKHNIDLASMDVVLIRQDPPVDASYVISTQILERLERQGVRVLNSPKGLRLLNEKLSIFQVEDCIAETIVTGDQDVLLDFLTRHQKIVVKAINSFGGIGVDCLMDRGLENNLAVIRSVLEKEGFVMAQVFLPAVHTIGDKRIVLIDGEPLPHVMLRHPADGDFRANLYQGGHYEVVELSAADLKLCERLKPLLQSNGLFLVGLDVVGGFITEINFTSPTGLRQIAETAGFDIGGLFWVRALSVSH